MRIFKYRRLLLLFHLPFALPSAHAEINLRIDDDKWISIGAGIRTSFISMENLLSGSNRSSELDLNNARLLINGQLHKYLKFEFNTECVFCSDRSLRNYQVLDGIVKFEFHPMFNIWAGRLLVPADRAEMSGPFFANTFDFNKTPFFPADFSVKFDTGGAGVLGRDKGINIWGRLTPDGRLTYVAGVHKGLQSSSGNGPNQDDNPLFATRITYNFLEVEKNPGYFTSNTYYGNGGDIFTLAYALQYQEDGTGSFLNPGDFLGMSIDLLFEKTLANDAVLTVESEYKYFNSDFSINGFTDADCFCMFDGDAWTATALYLFPARTGYGYFQPYLRYTENNPDNSKDRYELEFGLNYIIRGHNARISAFYQLGDIATKGLDFAPTARGGDVDTFKIAVQLLF